MSWIIEGFPRTKVQASALQKLGIIPDRFILLRIDKETSLGKIKHSLITSGQAYRMDDIPIIAENMLKDYEH